MGWPVLWLLFLLLAYWAGFYDGYRRSDWQHIREQLLPKDAPLEGEEEDDDRGNYDIG